MSGSANTAEGAGSGAGTGTGSEARTAADAGTGPGSGVDALPQPARDIAAGYAVSGTALDLGALLWDGACLPAAQIRIRTWSWSTSRICGPSPRSSYRTPGRPN